MSLRLSVKKNSLGETGIFSHLLFKIDGLGFSLPINIQFTINLVCRTCYEIFVILFLRLIQKSYSIATIIRKFPFKN